MFLIVIFLTFAVVNLKHICMEKQMLLLPITREELKEMIAEAVSGVTSKAEKPMRATIKGIRGLCEYTGISLATAHALVKSGQIPCSRYGTRYLFVPEEVDNALKVRRTE